MLVISFRYGSGAGRWNDDLEYLACPTNIREGALGETRKELSKLSMVPEATSRWNGGSKVLGQPEITEFETTFTVHQQIIGLQIPKKLTSSLVATDCGYL